MPSDRWENVPAVTWERIESVEVANQEVKFRVLCEPQLLPLPAHTPTMHAYITGARMTEDEDVIG